MAATCTLHDEMAVTGQSALAATGRSSCSPTNQALGDEEQWS